MVSAYFRRNNQWSANQRTLLPEPAAKTRWCQSVFNRNGTRTYVCRESKEAIPLSSIPRRYFLERTRLQISCGEYDTQCYDSWTGRVGRAICERSPTTGFLQRSVRLTNSAPMRLGSVERFTWTTSSAVCCKAAFAFCPSSCVMAESLSTDDSG